MSFYGSRALGRYGSGMMGAFGISGRAIFPNAPAGFQGSDTPDVWLGNNSGFSGNGFIALSQPLLNQAGDVWLALQNSTAPADINFASTMAPKLTAQAAAVDQAVGDHSILGYSASATQTALNALRQLQASVRQIAAWQVSPNPAPSITATPSATAGTISQGVTAYPSTTSGSSMTVLGSSQGAATAAPGSDNTLLYVSLAIGAVVLLGGGLYIRKRRSMAGYRRRRSRRSRR